VAEPWFRIAESVVLPPLSFWFDWCFEGLERIPREGPAILACNHQSYLDPLANAYAVEKAGRRPRFLAKDDLFTIPLVGTVLRGAHQIPVSRGTGDPAPLRRAVRAIAEGEVVLIYPEATVTSRSDLLPMDGKTGTVRLSLETGVPITPIASWGSHAVWQKSGKGSLRFGRPVWVKTGEPLDFSVGREGSRDRDAVKEMTARVMEALTALATDLRDRYPKRWSNGR
jgi:1-acyl-sn-glycerol-3-phosphate acyltransferase